MRCADITRHNLSVEKSYRAKLKNQTARVVWFTGLSGSGKSVIACAVEKILAASGNHTYMLDGDNVRHTVCKDLDFSQSGREENIRRVGEISSLMVDAGLVVLCAFISPYSAGRNSVRGMFSDKEFIEVFVDTPLEVCEERDTKGLYRKARAGIIPNLTGIGSEYEPPNKPEITIKNNGSIDQAANQVITYLKSLSN
jgi:adenylylsulfate kinase